MPHAKETRLIYKRLGIPGYTTDIDTLKDVADAICVDFPAEEAETSRSFFSVGGNAAAQDFFF